MPPDPVSLAWIAAGGLAALALAGFGLESSREHEARAARLAFALAFAAAALTAAGLAAPSAVRAAGLAGLAAAGIWGLALSLRPAGRPNAGSDAPAGRYDERDIPFSRIRLAPGSPEHAAYYALRPEKLAPDEELRRLPGLLSESALLADPVLFASPGAGFFLTEALRGAVDGPVARERQDLAPGPATDLVKSLALYYGAREAGVAALRPYHVYSHVGRGAGAYGRPIPFEPGFAIAFTVEMDFRMTRAAPGPAAVMESARQYVEAARVAVQLAAAVRRVGYPARAHIDGNYRVIAPLVARDAGLGEIGRMGLLMTPRLGPRVRLGVVTTELELVPDPRLPDGSVVDFCLKCAKCVRACPAGAIPSGGRKDNLGARRWRLDGDACFRYWSVVGTDCARCLAVCPYSHAGSFFHNLVRAGIRRSGAFRRAAVLLDDFFYGRKPGPAGPPEWVSRAGTPNPPAARQ